MHKVFGSISFNGTVALGQGDEKSCGKLFINEKVGSADEPIVDIAVKPLECMNSVAFDRPNALAVIAIAPKG